MKSVCTVFKYLKTRLMTRRQHNLRMSRRGFTFIMAVVMLLAFLVIGASCLQLANANMVMAQKQYASMRAFNVAEAYADYTEAWMRQQTSMPTLAAYPDGVNMLTQSGWTTPPTFDTSTDPAKIVSCTLWPNQNNSGLPEQRFLIDSVATYHGVTREVIYQLRQQSFGLYMYFTDQEKTPGGSTIEFAPFDHIYGPVHTNGQFTVDWSSTTDNGNPIFYGTVSSVSTSVNWSPNAPSTNAQWQDVLYNGQPALTLGVSDISLPASSTLQQQAAWGYPNNPLGYPTQAGTANGVYVANDGSGNAIGGIYLYGDTPSLTFINGGTGVQEVKMAYTTTTSTTNSSSRSPQTGSTYVQTAIQTTTNTTPITLVTQNMNTKNVQLSPGTDTVVSTQTTVTSYKNNQKQGQPTVTTVTNPMTESLTSTTTYAGLTNGVIYCTGDIGSSSTSTGVSGTLVDNLYSGTTITQANAWTVATNISAGNDIYISGNLTYQTQPNLALLQSNPSLGIGADSVYCTQAATLGLLADCVNILNPGVNNPSGELQIDASIMAGYNNSTDGTFTLLNYNQSGVVLGTLQVIGGIIQKYRGPVGTVSGSGTVETGFAKDYVYDPRLGTSPPPYYPVDGDYDMISWQSR